MKVVKFILLIVVFGYNNVIQAQGVGISETGAIPDASAALDLDFSNKGVLIPRMTSTERDAIFSPANALFIFNTTDMCFQVRNTITSNWENMYCFSGCNNSPSAPSSNSETNKEETSFTANWSVSFGADNYFLDVSTVSNFTSFVSGFENLNVGNVIEYNVTGLTCGTTYYYRIRANNSCGTSISSNTITASSATCIVYCLGSPTTVIDVTNPTTGDIWMDRNLGASQVASSSADPAAYGSMYQWGRRSDGHQCPASPTTNTNSSEDDPGHGNFILNSNTPFDWRSPQNDNLWQGLIGVNNPCPSGYRIPTEIELENERLSWATNDNAGAFGSPLKHTTGGIRRYDTGAVWLTVRGYRWSSTVSGIYVRHMRHTTGSAVSGDEERGNGMPVRCIKD